MEKYEHKTRTVQEELARERKFWKQNQIWTILLAVVVLFSALGRSGVSVAPKADELMLSMHNGSTAVVPYGSIRSVQLLEDPDYGTTVEGKDTRNGKSGAWEHLQWGSYTLCVYGSCGTAVKLDTEDHIYVVNLPSEEETRQLYQLIQDKLPESR